MTGVPLEFALGWQTFYFWAFQTNNHASECQVIVLDYFFETPKKKFLYPNATSNGTPVTGISKAAQNNWNPPSKVNIERATAICLNFLNFSPFLGFFLFFYRNGYSSPNIHFRWGVSIVLDSFWHDLDRGTIRSCIRMAEILFLGVSKK